MSSYSKYPAKEKITDEVILKEINEIKTFNARIIDVDENNVIIMVEGWRMGVYFDLSFDELEKYKSNKDAFKGRNVDINYIGELSNPHSLKFLPIKSLV